MRNALFYGSGVALVTPFSGGKIDLRAFEALIHWQIDMLTDAIIVLAPRANRAPSPPRSARR